MMSDPSEVEDLRKRDQEKYGNPDGPTFEWLVNQNQQKGLAGDAVYEAIVVSSQRTDKKVNESFNLKGKDQ
jgi:PII-like signaling protein